MPILIVPPEADAADPLLVVEPADELVADELHAAASSVTDAAHAMMPRRLHADLDILRADPDIGPLLERLCLDMTGIFPGSGSAPLTHPAGPGLVKASCRASDPVVQAR
jgi:hypothetical protein